MLKIINGIIQGDNINGIPFRVDLVSENNLHSRPHIKMTPTSHTTHNTGNTSKGANANMHAKYLKTVTKSVGYHFAVDDLEIVQTLPLNEIAWHAGDGRIVDGGNMTSIGTEICENSDGDWDKAKFNAANLISELMKSVSTIKVNVPHQYWKSKTYPNGKYCPHRILDEGWDKFENLVESVSNVQPTVQVEPAKLLTIKLPPQFASVYKEASLKSEILLDVADGTELMYMYKIVGEMVDGIDTWYKVRVKKENDSWTKGFVHGKYVVEK